MSLLPGPGNLAVSGAGLLMQEPAVASPLPGGVATVVRVLLNLPAGLQVAGVAVGALGALTLVVLLWRRRERIRAWVVARPRNQKIWLGAAAAAALLFGAAFGAVSWDYTQHDNDFCTGCHVMDASYARFTQSEHSTLSCHDCHQQSIVASIRQLYLWVAERPSEIGPHAKVPNAVCARCHVTGEREVWQRIASTAGHRTHLESANPALDSVQCVTCHAVEVHHFAPLDRTCAQSGCHEQSQIALGEMRGQTALHCTACHRFTAEVPALATRDSAAGALTPGGRQCFSCHEMRRRLAGMDMDPGRDPHRGTCGMCHHPHTQRSPAEARGTCTTSGCHPDWRAEPFHVGAQHRVVGTQCTLCHQPHQAAVDASDCVGCHTEVRARRPAGRQPPLPFDTTEALKPPSSGSVSLHPDPPKQKGSDPPWVAALPPRLPPPRPAPPDTFSHDRHRRLPCLTCHVVATGRGRLTFEPPRGCQICHHGARAGAECAVCHAPEEYASPRPVTIAVPVGGGTPRAHPAAFSHETHRAPTCTACHTTAVSLAPDSATATCRACHDDHHAEGRACAACHAAGVEGRAAHAPPAEAHVGCVACHASRTVARLVPDRSFCLTCHPAQQAHQVERPCTVCHLLMEPSAFAERLRGAEESER